MRNARAAPCALLLMALLMPGAPGATDAPPPLREVRDAALQAGLEAELRSLRLEGAVKRRRLAVAVAGITHLECPRFAAVNGDVMMYAASLPKIAILLAAFRRLQDGELEPSPELDRQLTAMIRRSSNTAATAVLDRVGRSYVNELLQSEEYRLYDPSHNGGLWVGKPYSKETAFERDPLHNLSHGATAIQVARFFYLLETGRLLAPEWAARMKAALGDPGISHKFVAGMRSVRPKARLYRKSGTWRDFHADAALIEREGRSYVVVALAESRNGEQWLRSIARAVDGLLSRVPPSCEG